MNPQLWKEPQAIAIHDKQLARAEPFAPSYAAERPWNVYCVQPDGETLTWHGRYRTCLDAKLVCAFMDVVEFGNPQLYSMNEKQGAHLHREFHDLLEGKG